MHYLVRYAKGLFIGCLALMLGAMWLNRGFVTSAYAATPNNIELKLSGVNFDIERAELEPSDLIFEPAPDTRNKPVALSYVEPTELSIVEMNGGRNRFEGVVSTSFQAQQKLTEGQNLSQGQGQSQKAPTSTVQNFSRPSFSLATPSTARTTNVPRGPVVLNQTAGTEAAGTGAAGNQAAVANATVRIERHTENGIGVLDVYTDERGYWSAEDLPGGRYRVRAWLPGQLTTKQSEVLFVDAPELDAKALSNLVALSPSNEPALPESAVRPLPEVTQISFELVGASSKPSLELIDSGPMFEDVSSNIAIVATKESIDAEGRIVASPMTGTTVLLKTSADTSILSEPSVQTSSDGAARFSVLCNQPGTNTITVSIPAMLKTFSLPTCERPIVVPQEPASEVGASQYRTSPTQKPTTSSGTRP